MSTPPPIIEVPTSPRGDDDNDEDDNKTVPTDDTGQREAGAGAKKTQEDSEWLWVH